jgi:hypothetical protein
VGKGKKRRDLDIREGMQATITEGGEPGEGGIQSTVVSPPPDFEEMMDWESYNVETMYKTRIW